MYSYGPPTYGRSNTRRPARTYIQQLCKDTGCSLEDLPEVMNDREKWRERVGDIHASGTTWWWGWNSIVTLLLLLSFIFSNYTLCLRCSSNCSYLVRDFRKINDFWRTLFILVLVTITMPKIKAEWRFLARLSIHIRNADLTRTKLSPV